MRLQKRYTLQVAGGVVLALHALKHCVAAGLHGKVELGTQIGKRRQLLAELLRHDPGLQRTQADAQVGNGPADGFDQYSQTGFSRQIHAPGGDLDAGDDDLPVALFCQSLCLLHGQLQGGGTDRSTGIGNDAVGAEIHAAVLDL